MAKVVVLGIMEAKSLEVKILTQTKNLSQLPEEARTHLAVRTQERLILLRKLS